MSSAPIAVTIEYPRVEHPVRLEHLVVRLGFPVVPLLVHPFPTELDAESYAATLVRRLDGDERPVGLVVAVCLAAPIGHEVARLVTGRQGFAPTLVALDGAPVRPFDVIKAYEDTVAAYGGPDCRPRVSVTETALRQRPEQLLADIEEEFVDAATAALRERSVRAGTAAPIVRDTVGTSMAWLRHLVAGHNAAFPPWDGQVVLATSDEAYFLRDWPNAARTRRVAIGGRSNELVGHPTIPSFLTAEMAAVSGTRA
ncbi:MAG TPA: hypothetical protein VKJ07_22750 [Mycobacteriales bacterium]|nr:hypothetical protein [Mycobacteriales bacterium]